MYHHRDGKDADWRIPLYDRDGRMYEDDYSRQGEPATNWPKSNHSHGQSRSPSRHEQRWITRAQDDNTRRATPDRDSGIQIRGRASDLTQRSSFVLDGRHLDARRSSRHASPGEAHLRSRSRSYSPNPRPLAPSINVQVSKEVMLDGISVEIDEEDISSQLTTRYRTGELEDIRIIRDRRTGISRGFGYVRFPNLPAAQSFVDSNFPHILLHEKGTSGGQGGDDRENKVRIAYRRDREERSRQAKTGGDWTCTACFTLNFADRDLCFKCGSPTVDMSPYQAQARHQDHLNSGDSDAAMQGPASQFLLIRGLEPNVTEDLLAKGVSKLIKPSQSQTRPIKKSKVSSTTDDANLGARDGSIRRILLVRDRQSLETWRYGFAEFATVDDAQAAMARFTSLDRFTISSKPVSVSYIHTGVFVPAFEAIDDRLVFSPLSSPATKLRYWNGNAFVSELTVTKSEDDENALLAKQAKSSADLAAAAAQKEGFLPVTKEDDTNLKKRKTENRDKESNKSKKSTPAHLQFWSHRHAELHKSSGTKDKPDAENAKELTSAEGVDSSTETKQTSYADPSKLCCYLCSRQFKSATELNKHERLSQLHRDNLENDQLRRKASTKLERAGLATVQASAGDDDDTSQYRDRAKERRQVFGSSKKPALSLKKQVSPPPESQGKANAPETLNETSFKGAALLGKMGWSSGEGLGARGEGTTQAIATNIYAAGVGLGAEGGKLGDAIEEAARSSRSDYREFVQQTKDKAKARYENMS